MSRLAPEHVRHLAGLYLGWVDVLRALDDVDEADHHIRANHQGGCADGYAWDTVGARVRCRVPGGDVGTVAIADLLRAGVALLDPAALAELDDARARMCAHAGRDGDRAVWRAARADAACIWDEAVTARPGQLELFAA